MNKKMSTKPFGVRRSRVTTLFSDSLSAYKYWRSTLGSVMLKRNAEGRFVKVY